MCGIAGIFNYADPTRQVDRDLLTRMTRRLLHRGPDDEGFFVRGPIGLGHRRLSIVDLSPTGRQPMESPSGQACIAYNGELYNHRAFRERLQARGSRFRGTSDTEVMLHLLEAYGPDALRDVAGIFGLAHWDQAQQRLLLVRDPLGVKQLYYFDDGERLLFASEVKAVLECAAVPRELDTEALNQYLHFHTALFDRTFFRHVKQVRAGEYVEVNRHGPRAKLYWAPDGFKKCEASPSKQVEALRELLSEVVGQQLMSDVPVGAFFSGGIDSSAVAAYAKRHGHRLRCFGVHFTDQGVIDERKYQEEAAAALGLELELTTMDGSTFPEDLHRLMYFQDQPVVGAAMLPMFQVSRLAAAKVKVCLGGQAADEIFGGYARYALAHPSKVVLSWVARRRSLPSASAGSRESASVGGNLFRQLMDARNLRRLARPEMLSPSWEGRYFENFAQVRGGEWGQIFPGNVISRQGARQVFHDTLARSPADDPADKLMHWDLQTYLVGLFHQDDRMSMANSLESRVPLADPRIVQLALKTPFDLKFNAGATKWILRQAVADAIPEQVLNRRKVGFDTPAASWMRGPHRDFVRDTLSDCRARTRGFWSPRAIELVLEDEGHPRWFDIAWKLLSIETWAKVFLDRKEPAIPAEPRVPDVA